MTWNQFPIILVFKDHQFIHVHSSDIWSCWHQFLSGICKAIAAAFYLRSKISSEPLKLQLLRTPTDVKSVRSNYLCLRRFVYAAKHCICCDSSESGCEAEKEQQTNSHKQEAYAHLSKMKQKHLCENTYMQNHASILIEVKT